MPCSVFGSAHVVGVSNKDNDCAPISCTWDTAQETQCLVKDAQGEVGQRLEGYSMVHSDMIKRNPVERIVHI